MFAALAVVLFWSGFNIVSRLGATATFTPFDLAAIRFAVSGAIALPLFLDEQLGPTTIAGIVVVSVGAMLCSLG